MNKQQLIEWVENNSKSLMSVGLFTQLHRIVSQLSEPEPETIPFEWPVPEGYEVFTRDGRKVTQLVKFDCTKKALIGGVLDGDLFTWYENGVYNNSGESIIHIFLRKIAPEMVTVWLNYYGPSFTSVYDSEEDANRNLTFGRIGPAIRVQFEKPKNS